MAVGMAAATANAALDSIVGLYIQIHTGDPGAAGSANVAGVPARQSASWGPSSAGQKQINNQPVWTSFPGDQTVTHISQWSASSGGTFKDSAALAQPVAVKAGGSFTLTTLSHSLGPVAA